MPVPAVKTADPCGAGRRERSGSVASLLDALHAAELPDEEQPAADAGRRDTLGPIPVFPAPRRIRHTLGLPLQVLLRFRMDGPLQPQMADVIEYINNHERDLVVALPPDLPVRPEQHGEIHLLSGQPHRLDPPLFTVKRVDPGSMLTLAVLELDRPA